MERTGHRGLYWRQCTCQCPCRKSKCRGRLACLRRLGPPGLRNRDSPRSPVLACPDPALHDLVVTATARFASWPRILGGRCRRQFSWHHSITSVSKHNHRLETSRPRTPGASEALGRTRDRPSNHNQSDRAGQRRRSKETWAGAPRQRIVPATFAHGFASWLPSNRTEKPARECPAEKHVLGCQRPIRGPSPSPRE